MSPFRTDHGRRDSPTPRSSLNGSQGDDDLCEWSPGQVGRDIARRVHQRLADGTLTERQAAKALYVAVQKGFSPDAEFTSMAYTFDDGVDLAIQGIVGDLAQVRAEMLDYLARAERR